MCVWYHILNKSIITNPTENNYTPKYNTVITVPALQYFSKNLTILNVSHSLCLCQSQ